MSKLKHQIGLIEINANTTPPAPRKRKKRASRSSTNKIPSAFSRKLTKALRSGRYKQGYGMMYNPVKDTYDVIGVAHRIAGVAKEVLSARSGPLDTYRYVPGVLTGDGELIDKLNEINDSGMTFGWIAKYIERYHTAL